ncbi:MAG TPA: isochorismatase family protein [Stellaceae bacterium]|nr:isochorismatase family protein [Stellaceae bacterium]
MTRLAKSLCLALAFAGLLATRATAIDIDKEWSGLQMPPPPTLKPVTVDSKTTALLLFDFMTQNCNKDARPRCLTVIPIVKKLDDEARAKGMLVAYTFPGGGTVVDQSIAPKDPSEVVDQKQGGADKFLGSDLDQRLKDHGIKTVILCGNSAQGVGIGTGSEAAQRGYNVIYPVDCSPAESAFREAYAAYHLGGGGPPVTTKWVTVTRSDMITFQ